MAVLLVVTWGAASFGYTGANVSFFDIQPSDVQGPQPIRVFPTPAAANMSGATLLYDNSAKLGFSTSYATTASTNRTTFPLTAPGITINSLDYEYGTGKPTGVDNSLFYFTNTETTPIDNRFPTHIPRPGRWAGEDYSAVQFVLGQPAQQFGVFVAMNAHEVPQQPPYDDNNVKMYNTPPRKLWVAVLGENDTFATAQMQQITVGGLYAPFIKVTSNGTDPIKSVCIVQDALVEYNAPFGFFDVYVVPPLTGDINNDGYVNVVDLQRLVAKWASGPNYQGPEDLNKDGYVNVGDLQLLVANWGTHR